MADGDHRHEANYFGLRNRLLGEYRNRLLATTELCEASRVIYGKPDGLCLYGIPASRMTASHLEILGRTAIECTVDQYVDLVASALRDLQPHRADDAMIVDLFCGSGNFGHQLGKRLHCPVFAAELDPLVYSATRNNLNRVGSPVELRLMDYRDLLATLAPRGPHDIYIVEPPWGPALTTEGLDLSRTSPPVRDILDNIMTSRDARSCLIAIKTNDHIANNSLTAAFSEAVHLRTLTPPPALPRGANMVFHIYRLGAENPAGPESVTNDRYSREGHRIS